MQILNTIQKITNCCNAWRAEGQRIVLVPTMGYYHAGHEALMRHARTLADAHGGKVVVSLFVNPTQFAPGEDLAAYPRDLERDAAMAKALGVDALFTPEVEDMYPAGACTMVSVPDLSRGLCGISRPTHFQGVCTVVAKLFLLTGAHAAVFGQKDWQQLAVIRRMVRDLFIPIEVVGHEIVREADGLAMSSRNVYLTEQERAEAPEIRKALLFAREMVAKGEKNVALLQQVVLSRWAERLPLGRLDYLSVVDADTLEPQEIVGEASLMACAVRVGKARLIDNILLTN